MINFRSNQKNAKRNKTTFHTYQIGKNLSLKTNDKEIKKQVLLGIVYIAIVTMKNHLIPIKN